MAVAEGAVPGLCRGKRDDAVVGTTARTVGEWSRTTDKKITHLGGYSL
jgi:hypothetical protein